MIEQHVHSVRSLRRSRGDRTELPSPWPLPHAPLLPWSGSTLNPHIAWYKKPKPVTASRRPTIHARSRGLELTSKWRPAQSRCRDFHRTATAVGSRRIL